ncbi:hypothetical protein HYT54_02525 [Candidatus Woesearchaeota archaeon]|nr:hypothetical protein [Candidatus Woesearchaeota archaeon]
MEKLLRYIGIIVSFGIILFMFMVIADAVSTFPTGYAVAHFDRSGSCEDSCGEKLYSSERNCRCDEACITNGDCCFDYKKFCD